MRISFKTYSHSHVQGTLPIIAAAKGVLSIIIDCRYSYLKDLYACVVSCHPHSHLLSAMLRRLVDISAYSVIGMSGFI